MCFEIMPHIRLYGRVAAVNKLVHTIYCCKKRLLQKDCIWHLTETLSCKYDMCIMIYFK